MAGGSTWVAWGAVVLALGGCDAVRDGQSGSGSDASVVSIGTTQEDYGYPGCQAATADGGCPRALTARCAVEAIRANHALCFEEYDCERVTLSSPCFPLCEPLVVNFDEAGDFRDEAQREIDRYCSGGACVESGSCAPRAGKPVCRGYLCGWEDADAGAPDAG